MLRSRSTVIMIVLALFAAPLLMNTPACLAAQPAGVPVRVAILPFSMHTPPDLAYLQNGIRDMLTSRLAWQGKVQVIDRSATEQAVKGARGDVSLGEAVRIGGALKADYVLFGSLTALGQAISIDAKMAPVSGTGEPLSLYAQTRSMDEVIPQINQFAQQINQKVFARPDESARTAAAEAEALSTRNPELLVPGTMVAGDRISYLNPNFIEVTPEDSLRQSGLWRSQTFQGGIIAMDIGDFTGDGRQEIVTATFNKITVYRKENQGLKVIGTFNGTNVDHFLWVVGADTNRDGKDRIFVTNLKKLNTTRAAQSDSALGDPGYNIILSSFALSLEGGRLELIADNIPYFLNALPFGKRGKILLGQAKGSINEGPFKGDIYEMQLRGTSLVPTVSLNVPTRCNIFNFARADINNDKMEETIVIDKSNKMVILNSAGELIWRGDRIFAATTNTFEGKVEDRRFNLVDLYAIPSPIVVADINKDGIPEIIVNRSTSNVDKFLPDSMKSYDKSEIVSFSWDQMGLVENWKTREISGMVTGVRLGDLNGDGTTELVASLVLAKDLLKLWESKSTIFSYDLNVSPSKTAARQ